MIMLKKLVRVIHVTENALLVFILVSMLGLALLDIASRYVFSGGMAWVSPLVRVMVLWLGLQGALLATRNNEHISIDVLTRFLRPTSKRIAKVITLLFSAVVCGVIGWFSIEFVQGSFEYADEVFSGLPAWPFQIIIPISFTLMALRFFMQAIAYAFIANYSNEDNEGKDS